MVTVRTNKTLRSVDDHSRKNAIKSFLHFPVPDKGPLADADEYMPDFMKLLTKGITGNEDSVIQNVKSMVGKIKEQMGQLDTGFGSDLFSGFTLPQMQAALAGGGTTTTNNNKTTNLGGVRIYVNGYNVQNDDQLADKVATRINEMLDEDESVFR